MEMKRIERLAENQRLVAAPPPSRCGVPVPVINVVLNRDEEVEWHWTHRPDGTSVVTGYTIVRKEPPFES